jgi:spore coat protein U-like protein
MHSTLTKPVLLFALLAAIPSAASAGTAATSFTVSATVADSCTVSAAALDFGSYTVTSASAATTTVTVTCTNDTAYHVALSDGGNFTTTRRMVSNVTNFLEYELYTNEGRTTRWGNTEATDVDGTGNGSAQALTVYGLVPSGQFVTAGSYTDTIDVTVTYP